MKLLITLSLLYISTASFAQFPIDKETGDVKYTGVLSFEGTSKQALYSKAKFWVVTNLKSGDNMVELSGTNTDQIVGTGNITLDSLSLGKQSWQTSNLNFKFIVMCKDGRLKYSLENITLSFLNLGQIVSTRLPDLSGLEAWGKRKEKFADNEPYLDSELKQLVYQFISYMNKDEKDDW